ncbi:glycosyl transferase family 28 [Occultella glacieicola]|uniref:Glycosyl transferase family 28 n=1 Tax=Occultella glacieicola TaxID=2518684 RepID=A0ABY2E427_9MICO|nr:glycosyltransferase [Occultella glacieicola]TDE94772.1 glycosyl transferase family 28 [Occultella glacieicola]
MTRRRIALYSHDTQGLGHIRRNIELAAALVDADADTDVLLLTGAPEATALPLPANTEVLTLPTVAKDSDGGYGARVFDLSLAEVLELRSRIIAAALTSFTPDLFIVDKVARGLGGELDRTLRTLRGNGRTRVVLGLRDVLDSPDVTRREWRDANTTSVLLASYDQVWVYGDAGVYDLVAEYRLPGPVARMTHFTGYLGHGRGRTVGARPRRDTSAVGVPADPYVLCMVGGGQDGSDLARAFTHTPLPAGHRGVLVTGPYMDAATRTEVHRAAADRDDLSVHEFVTDAVDLVRGARAMVTMGGYNTVCEVLASARPALVVPRERPRMEQAIRADRLAGSGYLDTMRAHRADPERLGEWLAEAVHRGPRPHPIDLDGLSSVPALARRLLTTPLTLESPRVSA